MFNLRRIVTFIVTFATAQAGWVALLMAAFSTGGILMVLGRLIAMIRGRAAMPTRQARLRRDRDPGLSSSLALSGSW